MKYEIVNKFSEAGKINVSPVKNTFSLEQFKSHLNEASSGICLKRTFPKEHVKINTSCRIFLRFLEFARKTQITPDENLIEEFRAAALRDFKKDDGKNYQIESISSVMDDIRILLNRFFYKKGLIQRPILNRKAFLKYKRFSDLTEKTRNLIVDFEGDGRCARVTKRFVVDSRTGEETVRFFIELKTKRLSDYNRKSYIDKVISFLSFIGMSGIEEVTKNDLEKFLKDYRDKGKEETGKAYLAALYSLIANGIGKGKLKENPFDNFLLEKREHKSREDFLMPDQVEKILDLDSLDKSNPEKVRNRLLTLLIYDTGLRASTISQLEYTDIKELPDGMFQVQVKGIFLKGKKQDKALHLLFHPTIALLKIWLNQSRVKLSPDTNRLFVSLKGIPLTRSGVLKIVQRCSRELGIVTVKKKIPTPHTLRHTLATLNIEPFGKSLSPRLMQQRLIHMDLETLERNYVHNNPLAEMAEYKKLLEKDHKKSAIERIPREDFFEILDFLNPVKAESRIDIKEAYDRKVFELKKDTLLPNVIQNNYVPEERILDLLDIAKLDNRTLRKWGMLNRVCKKVIEGNSTKYLYDETPFRNLQKDYLRYDEAYKKFRGGRTRFFELIKLCQKVKIGRHAFILKDDFLKYLIEESEGNRTCLPKYHRKCA